MGLIAGVSGAAQAPLFKLQARAPALHEPRVSRATAKLGYSGGSKKRRKSMSLRLTAALAAALAFAAPAASLAAEAAYPTKPIRLIVAFPAGGSTDIIGRLVAQRLSQTLGQQVIVDNRGGAGGIVGTEIAARSNPDGYTLT